VLGHRKGASAGAASVIELTVSVLQPILQVLYCRFVFSPLPIVKMFMLLRVQLSGSIYHGGADLSEIMAEAFKRFSLSNPLHPEMFPAVRKVRGGGLS
jgi:hypothetical protein